MDPPNNLILDGNKLIWENPIIDTGVCLVTYVVQVNETTVVTPNTSLEVNLVPCTELNASVVVLVGDTQSDSSEIFETIQLKCKN